MMAFITHQWRQPLNMLGLVLQNLRYDSLENRLDRSSLLDGLARAEQAVAQMVDTIDDFCLFFSGGTQARKFSLLATAHKCADLTYASLKAHWITLDIAGEDVCLIGVERELLHVLLNLVGAYPEFCVRGIT